MALLLGLRGHSKALLMWALLIPLTILPAVAERKAIDWDKRLKKGYYELSIGNMEKAIKIFSSEAKKHPEAGPPHTALGRALKKDAKKMEAKGEFRRATEVDPSYPDAYYELGAMMESDKEYALAAQAFETYLQLAPYSTRKVGVSERIRFCKEHQQ